MLIELQKVYFSKDQANWPLYRLSCMRKRLSISSRVSCETTFRSVNPVLIVLEASFLSLNPVPIVREYIHRYRCISTGKLNIRDLLPYWSVCFPAMSINFRWHPYSLRTSSANIRRNFPSHYWCG